MMLSNRHGFLKSTCRFNSSRTEYCCQRSQWNRRNRGKTFTLACICPSGIALSRDAVGGDRPLKISQSIWQHAMGRCLLHAEKAPVAQGSTPTWTSTRIVTFRASQNQEIKVSFFALKKMSNQGNTVNCISAWILVLVCFEYVSSMSWVLVCVE